MKNKSVILILFMLFSITTISLMSLSTITVVADEGGGPPFMDWDRPPRGDKEGNYWDFNNDTVIGWHISMKQGSFSMSFNIIYNISSMKYLINASGDEENGYYDSYGVMLNQMYFNTSTNSLKEYTNHTTHPIINASLINYTNTKPSEKMVPFNFEKAGGAGPFLTPFIPKNTTTPELDLHWCANASRWLYGYLLTNGTEVDRAPNWGVSMSVSTSSNSTHYWNDTLGTYADMFYYPNGTLRTGEIKAYVGGPDQLQTPMTVNMTRIFDFNPLDDLEWSVDVGDVFYMGIQGNESKIEIVKFENFTTDDNYPYMMPLALQKVIANMSFWDKDTMTWYVFKENGTIGVANEDYTLAINMDGLSLLVPNGSTGSTFAESYTWLTLNEPDITLEYGDYWLKIINNTTPQGIAYQEYFPDGKLKYFYTDNFQMGPEPKMVVYFLNNITINGERSAKIYPFGTNEFQITVNISVSADKLLLYSGFHRNPFDVNLEDGLVFFDVMLNDTATLDPPINITIKYNEYKYENINLWWFDRSADGGNGAWEVVAFTDLGDGKIIAFVDHTSVFALTGTEIPPKWNWNWNWNINLELPLPPPPPSEISFGYFFLIFTTIGIIGLAIYKKRKI